MQSRELTLAAVTYRNPFLARTFAPEMKRS
jgi:hypothetical protein